MLTKEHLPDKLPRPKSKWQTGLDSYNKTKNNIYKTDCRPLSINRKNRISSYKKAQHKQYFDAVIIFVSLTLILIIGIAGNALSWLEALLFWGTVTFFDFCTLPDFFGAKRWPKYEEVFEYSRPKNDTMQLEEISEYTGITQSQIRGDIFWLIRYGIIPEDWYELGMLYLPDVPACEKKAAVQEETKPVKKEAETTQAEVIQNESPAITPTVLSKYAEKISELSERVKDAKMSEKVSALREITAKITNYADSHPENAKISQKLTNYYFPTIIHLLDVFVELDEQHITGKSAEMIRKEIQDTMDSVNTALNNAFEKMLANAEFDVYADAGTIKAKAELDELLPTTQAIAYQKNTEESI